MSVPAHPLNAAVDRAPRGRPRKIGDVVRGAQDAGRGFAADARRMLISHATTFSELQSRVHGRVLTDADEAWDASRQTSSPTR